MRARPLGGIAEAWLIDVPRHEDARGAFTELVDLRELAEATGEPPLDATRWCASESRRDVVRGLHASWGIGRRKAVTCLAGAVQDVVVDLREYSPTYLRWAWIRLCPDDDRTTAQVVVVGDGIAHGFCVLGRRALVGYLLEGGHVPGDERTVHPLDPSVGVVWATPRPVLSERDASAPFLV